MSRIDHPSRDLNHALSEAAAKKRLEKGLLKFENEAERRDYEKRVKANPFNNYGNPVFYPPVEIKSSLSGIHPMISCKTEGCGGSCAHVDGYLCFRCGKYSFPDGDESLWGN